MWIHCDTKIGVLNICCRYSVTQLQYSLYKKNPLVNVAMQRVITLVIQYGSRLEQYMTRLI